MFGTAKMTEREVSSYFKKVESNTELPQGFSFTGGASPANLFPKKNSNSKKSNGEVKRRNYSGVYDNVPNSKKKTTKEPRGYKKGISCKSSDC